MSSFPPGHPCDGCTHLTRGVVVEGAIRGWFCPLRDCRRWREDQQRSRERRAREDDNE